MFPVSLTTDTALLFPGQGSQTDDMRDLVAERAPELLERCTELVGEDPFARVDESTRFQQPAIFCASIAGWHGLAEDVEPGAAAGHSLGELAALAAAGVLTRRRRARARRAARPPDGRGRRPRLDDRPRRRRRRRGREGRRGRRPDRRQRQRARARSCSPATASDFDRAEELAGELGKRAIRLPVAGAFHSPSMAPAVAPFRAALDEVELGEPRFTVFSCASAQPFADVRDELARALIRPVRWRETFTALHDAGATRFIEVGPGKVLARLAKRIVPGTKVETPAEERRQADPASKQEVHA